MATERQLWVGFHTVACVALLVGLLGSAHPVQQGLLGKAPTLSSARYRITLETPQTIFQRQDAAVVVRVQNEQGLPVDGLLVALQVDPPWARYAVDPARAGPHPGWQDTRPIAGGAGRSGADHCPGRRPHKTGDDHCRHAHRHRIWACRGVPLTTGGD
jgi:hypothetical protein